MQTIKILWADDEIDLLKPQIMFLESKGYEVIPVTNGQDAIDKVKEIKELDVVFLDESMPGLTGLETLPLIKEIKQHLPVVMITKNEEEDLMEDAIGSQITDYLIKPVRSQQILLTLKKIIDERRLVREKTQSNYQQEFQKLFMRLQDSLNFDEWAELYKKLTYWELELDKSDTSEMADVFFMQKNEANKEFSKFVAKNYEEWFSGADAPIMSHQLFKTKVLDLLKEDKPTYFVLIDNLRYDQWKVIEPILLNNFRVVKEDMFYSILPTATQYSRNSIFSGLTPLGISKEYPNYWKNDDEEGGKNLFEEQLLGEYLKRTFRDDIKFSYTKVTNFDKGKELEDRILNGMSNKLNAIVYNFVDTISHAKTEMDMIKELASDDAAFRSLTLSWFEHSPLHNALKKLVDKDVNIVITTDHGTKLVKKPSKCQGDRHTSTNIRYKMGRNLNYEKKDVLEILHPEKVELPISNLSSSYIFAKEDSYLVYQNNYNKFVNYFKDTFQHGGISLEEVIIPFVQLKPR